MAPTKDELETENAALRDRVAELEAGAALGASPGQVDGRGRAPAPSRLTNDAGEVILSAGEANDLALNGVTVSPFTGETLTASREGVEPTTPEAARNDRRVTAELERAESVPGEPPLAEAV